MTQIVKFPDRVWGRLASLAETREVSIADLLVETAEHLIPPPTPEPVKRRHGRSPVLDWEDELVADRIRHLRSLHWSVAAIARDFGVSDGSMRTAFRHLGLPTGYHNTTNPKENAQ